MNRSLTRFVCHFPYVSARLNVLVTISGARVRQNGPNENLGCPLVHTLPVSLDK